MSIPFLPRKIDRRSTAQQLLQKELSELSPEDRHVVERFIARQGVARNIEREFQEARTLGERVADRVAAVGGSWGFIIFFGVVLVIWMLINSDGMTKPFDPYPFILLNLVLSCLAAVQAPIIMMSQNRQADIDRLNAKNDYQVNVKAELEVLQLHEKIDQLREHDWLTVVELQNRQIELLHALLAQSQANHSSFQDANTHQEQKAP